MTSQVIHAAHGLRVLKHQKILLSFIGKYFWNRIPLSVGDQTYQYIYLYLPSYSFTIPSDKGLKKCSKQPATFQSFYDENLTLSDIINVFCLLFYYFISINLIKWIFIYDRYACKYYFPELKLIPSVATL